jgi:hypothetical protein
VECDKSSKSRSRSQLSVAKDTHQEIMYFRWKYFSEEASVVSMKLPKDKVSKSLIAIDHEGGHVSVDRELREKAVQEKRA